MKEIIITAITRKGHLALLDGVTGKIEVPTKIKILARGLGIKQEHAIKMIVEQTVICENPYTVSLQFSSSTISAKNLMEIKKNVIATLRKNGAEEIKDYILTGD